MTLSEYIASAPDETDETFAGKVGCSRSMITRLRGRSVNPSSQLAARIIEQSGRRISFEELIPAAAPAEAAS